MSPVITDTHLFALGATWEALGVGVAALLGGDAARCAAVDYFEEHGEAWMNPFQVGETYLIQTVTLYYVGRVRRNVGAFVELEDASWVHWTGRLSRLVEFGRFDHAGWPDGEARPRTEYVGVVGVNLAAIVAYLPGDFALTRNSY